MIDSALPPPSVSPTTLSFPTAGVVRRLAAIIYDSLLVFGVLFAATIPALLLGHGRRVGNNEIVHELTPLAQGWWFQLYLLVIFISFFCWFWRKNGQTLGMQAWRLLVQSETGARLSIPQCLLRLLGATVSLACLGIGYWWAWIDRDGLTWHDRLSKSRVVVLPKKNPKTSL